jgi:hypothetical protein
MNFGRREFSFLAAGLATAAVLPIPDRVDRAHGRYLQAVLAQLRTQDDTVGGGAVLPQALRHLAHAHRMLDESDYSAAIGRELLIVTADLGIESAWFAHDADEQTLARQLYGRPRCWPIALVTARSACSCTPTWRSSTRTWLATPAAEAWPGKPCSSLTAPWASPVTSPPRRCTPSSQSLLVNGHAA